jgi:hypothetical protein
MTRVEPDQLEEEILAIRRARSRAAISRIRAKAKAEGLDRLTIDQINEFIAETRVGRQDK